MSTMREQLLAQIATLLQPIPNVGVYRSRQAAIDRAEGTTLVIRPEEEIVAANARDVVWREFRVLITIVARGDVPDQTADPIVLAVTSAMLTDQTLGGLCARVFEEETKWEFEEADQNAVAVVCRFLIKYATRAKDLSVQAPFQL